MATPHSRLVTIACIVAFLGAAIEVVNVVLGQILAVLFFAVFLVAGIGILQRRAWSAYGLSLILASQLLALGIVLFRSGGIGTPLAQVLAGAIQLVMVVLFF